MTRISYAASKAADVLQIGITISVSRSSLFFKRVRTVDAGKIKSSINSCKNEIWQHKSKPAEL